MILIPGHYANLLLNRQSGITPLQSIYDIAVPRLVDTPIETLQQRVPFMKNRKGANEPKWTSYTHFWKTTLGW
jgi:RNA exonuclease NGL2